LTAGGVARRRRITSLIRLPPRSLPAVNISRVATILG